MSKDDDRQKELEAIARAAEIARRKADEAQAKRDRERGDK